MINVCFLMQSFHNGGIETHTKNLTSYLKEKYPTEFCFNFIATSNPSIHPAFYKIGHPVFFKNDWARIEKYLRDGKIDVVQYGNLIEYKNVAIKAGVKKIIERTAGVRSLGLNKEGVNFVLPLHKVLFL